MKLDSTRGANRYQLELTGSGFGKHEPVKAPDAELGPPLLQPIPPTCLCLLNFLLRVER